MGGVISPCRRDPGAFAWQSYLPGAGLLGALQSTLRRRARNLVRETYYGCPRDNGVLPLTPRERRGIAAAAPGSRDAAQTIVVWGALPTRATSVTQAASLIVCTSLR